MPYQVFLVAEGFTPYSLVFFSPLYSGFIHFIAALLSKKYRGHGKHKRKTHYEQYKRLIFHALSSSLHYIRKYTVYLFITLHCRVQKDS